MAMKRAFGCKWLNCNRLCHIERLFSRPPIQHGWPKSVFFESENPVKKCVEVISVLPLYPCIFVSETNDGVKPARSLTIGFLRKPQSSGKLAAQLGLMRSEE